MGVDVPGRNPKDSMKSTWRTDPKAKWNFDHFSIQFFNIHHYDNTKPVPVHQKTDRMPTLSHWSCHRWILAYATWPLVVHQAYIYYMGKNLHPFLAIGFYSLAFIGNAIMQLRCMRHMGQTYGFLDGDEHERDGVPDHSVSKVMNALSLTATARPLMAIFLAWRGSLQPKDVSWWLPVEIGLYGVVLDFYFYWYHRTMHEVPWLWKFHRTHHLTKHPNPLLTLYADTEQELFDIAIIPLLTYLTLKYVFQLPMSFYDWWYCYQYAVFTELFGHSGIRIFATPPSTNTLFLRAFGCELATEDHDLHHRKGWKNSMNYGKQTLLWDTIFGTAGKRIECIDENINKDHVVPVPFYA